MHYIAGVQKHKNIWLPMAAAGAASALVVTLALVVSSVGAATTTWVVDDDGKAVSGNCNSNTVTPYTTVSSAVAAASAGDKIKVCPGAYAENVLIDKELSIKGAEAGEPVESRTFADASESTITGLVTIQASDVKLEGFSLTNPGQGLGVIVKTAADNAFIKKNIVDTVGSLTFAGPVVGIYLELGPDGAEVLDNQISHIQSQTGSAQGVLIGDSTSGNPSLVTRVEGNLIKDIQSVSKGAYGIQANNGASTAPTATGYTELEAADNTIRNLSGNWVHAIGLEGETPNAEVEDNVISNLTDTNPTPISDTIGVFFEANPFFFTTEVRRNSLNVTSGSFGIAVHPILTAQYPSLKVDGECNWWGASNGPSTVGTGSGSMVGPGVDFKPWLKSFNLGKSCND
jgi:hypothetical protein